MKTDVVSYHAVAASSPQDYEQEAEGASLPPYFQAKLIFLISLITIGSHYGTHSLSSLGPEIMQSLDVERTEFGFLFSSEEIPGIILPILGGVALTYVPHGPAAVVLSSSIFISTALCAIAVTHKSYLSLVVGRFLFGLSDGTLTTLQSALIAHWFKRKVGSGFGIMLLVSRLSSFLGLSLPAFLSHKFGLKASMWFSAAMCIPPLLATVFYAILNARYSSEHFLTTSSQTHPRSSMSTQVPTHHFPTGSRGFVRFLRSFPLSFWIVCYIWVAVSGSVYSMLHFAPDAFSTHLGLSEAVSGLLSGSLLLIAGLSSPAFGVVQDRIGRRVAILWGSCTLICIGILLCVGTVSSSIVPMLNSRQAVITGLCLIAAGFAAAPVTLMSCLALSVDDFVTAAALGLYKAAENAGLAIVHVLTGVLRDSSGNYADSFLLLAGLAGCGVVAAVILGRMAPKLRYRGDQMPIEEYEVDVF